MLKNIHLELQGPYKVLELLLSFLLIESHLIENRIKLLEYHKVVFDEIFIDGLFLAFLFDFFLKIFDENTHDLGDRAQV